MDWQKLTRLFFVGVILVVGIYDIAALALGGGSATISDAIGLRGSFESPFIPFGFGVIAGHLFWPQDKTKAKAP